MHNKQIQSPSSSFSPCKSNGIFNRFLCKTVFDVKQFFNIIMTGRNMCPVIVYGSIPERDETNITLYDVITKVGWFPCSLRMTRYDKTLLYGRKLTLFTSLIEGNSAVTTIFLIDQGPFRKRERNKLRSKALLFKKN